MREKGEFTSIASIFIVPPSACTSAIAENAPRVSVAFFTDWNMRHATSNQSSLPVTRYRTNRLSTASGRNRYCGSRTAA